ncbi:hypothetical protein CPB86DRAFT_785501 [Serendipita vermifera]|nr:hypothetical protein CPB86DRAFT_785501 [Serendipita vermifera]
MPLYTGIQEGERSGITQSYIAARNLLEGVTVPQLTELFDAAGVVANIKILANPQKREDGSMSRTAVIVYYSNEDAMRALQDLDGNASLNLSSPLELEYFGPSSMEQVEGELLKRSELLNGASIEMKNLLANLQSLGHGV